MPLAWECQEIIQEKRELAGQPPVRPKRPGPEFYRERKIAPKDTTPCIQAEFYRDMIGREKRALLRGLEEQDDPLSATSRATKNAATTVRNLSAKESQDFIFKHRDEKQHLKNSALLERVKKGISHSSEESLDSWWALWSPQIEIHGNAQKQMAAINPDAVHTDHAQMAWLPKQRNWIDPRQQVLRTRAMDNMESEAWYDFGAKHPHVKMKANHLGCLQPVHFDSRSGVREETWAILLRAIQELDPDRNGEILVEELRILLQKLSFNLSSQEFENLAREVDADRTGTIAFAEFRRAFPAIMRLKKQAQIQHLAQEARLKSDLTLKAKKSMHLEKRHATLPHRRSMTSMGHMRNSLSSSLGGSSLGRGGGLEGSAASVRLGASMGGYGSERASSSMSGGSGMSHMSESSTMRMLINDHRRSKLVERAHDRMMPRSLELAKSIQKLGYPPGATLRTVQNKPTILTELQRGL